jgi:hypothetical protein
MRILDKWLNDCFKYVRSFGLLNDTDSASLVAGGFGMLSSDLEVPVVPNTSVELHLGHSLDVLTQLSFEDV